MYLKSLIDYQAVYLNDFDREGRAVIAVNHLFGKPSQPTTPYAQQTRPNNEKWIAFLIEMGGIDSIIHSNNGYSMMIHLNVYKKIAGYSGVTYEYYV